MSEDPLDAFDIRQFTLTFGGSQHCLYERVIGHRFADEIRPLRFRGQNGAVGIDQHRASRPHA